MIRKRMHPFFDKDDGTGDGGQKPTTSETTEPTAQEKASAEVERLTAGLKSTNVALKAEKVALQEKFDAMNMIYEKLGGEEGVTALVEFQTRLSQDEVGKLLAEGKHQEWLDANLSAIKGEHTQTVNAMQTTIETNEARATKAEAAFTELTLDIAIRDACTGSKGFNPDATKDAQLWARSAFTVDPERGLVTKDTNGTVLLGKDGTTPMTIAEALEAQKETRRHWWGISEGAGAGGSIGGADAARSGFRPGMVIGSPEHHAYRKAQGLDDLADSPNIGR